MLNQREELAGTALASWMKRGLPSARNFHEQCCGGSPLAKRFPWKLPPATFRARPPGARLLMSAQSSSSLKTNFCEIVPTLGRDRRLTIDGGPCVLFRFFSI
jgi:hypothetical protein